VPAAAADEPPPTPATTEELLGGIAKQLGAMAATMATMASKDEVRAMAEQLGAVSASQRSMAAQLDSLATVMGASIEVQVSAHTQDLLAVVGACTRARPVFVHPPDDATPRCTLSS
jgi:hypothetical protein